MEEGDVGMGAPAAAGGGGAAGPGVEPGGLGECSKGVAKGKLEGRRQLLFISMMDPVRVN